MKDSSESPARQQHGPGLACRECQRKKIKCSRTFPCEQCLKSAWTCQISTRKPRAKVGARMVDAELRNRIAKLEKLVETFDGKRRESGDVKLEAVGSGSGAAEVPPASEEIVATSDGSSPVEKRGPSKTSRYVAASFWSSLTSEVKALADAFDEDESHSDDGTTPDSTPPSAADQVDPSNGTTPHYDLLLCPPGVVYIMPGAVPEPPPTVAVDLLSSFMIHVEPMYKLFHAPTLRKFLYHGEPYLNRSHDAPCNKALKACIYFAGATAFTDSECHKFGTSRKELVTEYRRAVDVALYQADPLNTTELATLQALVLYVLSARVFDSSQRGWTLLGLIVRIARAFGIHREIQGESIYLAELRCRLWYNIVLLDCYSSLDRGSEVAIHPDTFSRRLPTHANDEDFDEATTILNPRENQVTDMSMALIAMEGSSLTIKMSTSEWSPTGMSWQKRLEAAYAYQKRVNEKYMRHLDPQIPQHRIILGSGAAASHSMILRSVRPMQHLPQDPPPRVDSPWVIHLALNILRHADTLWQSMSGTWRRMPWIPWHAVAVTLAGLCSIRGTAVADEAWDLVHKCMTRYAPNIADSTDGMLWRPLEKLRVKAAAFRDRGDVVGPVFAPPRPPPVGLTSPARVPPPVASEPVWDVVGSDLPAGAMMAGWNMPPLSDAGFDFPPAMQAALPSDNSWLDWEAILQDIDEIRADDMQWL